MKADHSPVRGITAWCCSTFKVPNKLDHLEDRLMDWLHQIWKKEGDYSRPLEYRHHEIGLGG